MDGFAVNFDLYGGLCFDEWLEEDEKNTKPKNERYVALSNEELNQLEKSGNEANMSWSTI